MSAFSNNLVGLTVPNCCGTQTTSLVVGCDATTGRINQLGIKGNSPLITAVPDALGQLSGLVQLDMGGNGWTGTLPTSMSNLTALQSLKLGANKLSGDISILTTLTSLTTLDLNMNSFNGSLPGSLGQLSSLNSLDLSNNGFSGSVPDVFAGMAGLQNLQLANNDFTGPVPASIAKLSALNNISLGMNCFSSPPLYLPQGIDTGVANIRPGCPAAVTSTLGSNASPSAADLTSPSTQTMDAFPADSSPSDVSEGSGSGSDGITFKSFLSGPKLYMSIGAIVALIVLIAVSVMLCRTRQNKSKKARLSATATMSSHSPPRSTKSTLVRPAHPSPSPSTRKLVTSAAPIASTSPNNSPTREAPPPPHATVIKLPATSFDSISTATTADGLDPLHWTVEDVSLWLTDLGFGSAIVKEFQACQINGRMLIYLTPESMRRSMHVPRNAQKRLDLAILSLQSRAFGAVASPARSVAGAGGVTVPVMARRLSTASSRTTGSFRN
ncbi:hypothetical protein HK101_011514 [Irineochytrium annulatum]|nr:hypothetical protein HK101_011514 [Irineochytrium annulatum]